MSAFFVSVGIGLTLLLVLFCLGSAMGEPPAADPEDDDEDGDDTDLHTPTADVSTDTGVLMRGRLKATELTL